MARPEDLLLAAVSSRGEAPLVGWYDESLTPPARMELSARSVGTWAAKTFGLLVDECGVAPGDPVAVLLPSHWVTVAVLAGAWAAGVEVVTSPGSGVAVAVVPADLPDADSLDADEVFLVDPTSAWQLGGLPGLDGTDLRDLAVALRPHPDRLPGVLPGAPDDPALDGLARADVVRLGAERAAALSLGGSPRLGWTGTLATTDDVLAAVVAPWTAGGSVVLLNHLTDDRRAAVEAAEGLTRVV